MIYREAGQFGPFAKQVGRDWLKTAVELAEKLPQSQLEYWPPQDLLAARKRNEAGMNKTA